MLSTGADTKLVCVRPAVTKEFEVFAAKIRKQSVMQSLGLVVETVDEQNGGWSIVDSVKKDGLADDGGLMELDRILSINSTPTDGESAIATRRRQL
jgi:C-terminal processing protease CtpA/Prc